MAQSKIVVEMQFEKKKHQVLDVVLVNGFNGDLGPPTAYCIY